MDHCIQFQAQGMRKRMYKNDQGLNCIAMLIDWSDGVMGKYLKEFKFHLLRLAQMLSTISRSWKED